MIAKGLDFSNIGLVGILNADVDLFMTDLRAAEKTYQLINQVAGRAGRTNKNDSYVVIQSAVPTTYAINSIRQPLNIDFLEEELQNRKELNYPPYSRFVVIELSSKDNYFLNTKANYLYSILPKNIKELDILPPSEPNVVKVKNRYRKLIIIKNDKNLDPNGKVLRKYLKGCLDFYNEMKEIRDLKISVNVDASSIM
jgi:primosomal protein N' (replication factor Y)